MSRSFRRAVRNWVISSPTPLKRSHHDVPPEERYDGDTRSDIDDCTIDHFWSKCEEVLPDDWCLHLYAGPHKGQLAYYAQAQLIDEDMDPASIPVVKSLWRSRPERALEDLFYNLRDML